MQIANEDYPGSRRWIGAAILIVVGVLFLLDNLNILPFDQVWRFWPVGLIAVGIFMLIDRTVLHFNFPRYNRDEYIGASAGGYRIRESAVFSGGKRRINSQSFAGGKIDAVMGGFQIDLRDANMLGDVAIFDINVVFGGTELRIPDSWLAVVQGTGVFGAFTDNTRQPDSSRYPNPKRLIVRGGAVFGHVEVRN